MKYTDFLKKHQNLICFLIASLIYGISAGIKINEQSKTPQYIHLANSLLHLKPYLISLPDSTFDLISFNGKWYVPGGITPALLLMPIVAIWGTNFSDVLFGVIIGSLNVTLIYILISEINESKKIQIWLTTIFAFGTVHWWVSTVGSVWFNAQLTGVLFEILFVRATIQGRSWHAGSFFCLAFLSRPPILFSVCFYLFYIYLNETNFKSRLNRIFPFSIIVLSGLVLMAVYNYLRFGSLLEFGYGYVQGTASLTEAYADGGGFSLSYMPCNIYVSLFGMPNITWNPLPDLSGVCGHLQPIMRTYGRLSGFFNPIGMSIFLTTPAFLLVFKGNIKNKYVIASTAGILVTTLVLWMYHTTGWVQFGYRYILDVIVYVFLILGVTVKQVNWVEKILFFLSYGMGATGMFLMYYMIFGLVWNEMLIETIKKIYWMIF